MDHQGNGFFRFLSRWLITGPVDPDPKREPSWGETLFPWPVRLLAVVTAALLGWNWSGTPLGEQLGGGLHYAGLIAISLAVSFWFWMFVLNAGVALAWLLWPLPSRRRGTWVHSVGHWLAFINRQIGHIEVLSVWVVLALVAADRLAVQLALLTAVVFLGEPILNGLTRYLFFDPPRDPAEVSRDLYWKRRPLFYVANLLGFIIVILLSPRQWFKLVPGMLAVALADIIRYLRHRRLVRAMKKSEHLETLSAAHEKQRRWSRHTDFLLGPGLLLGFYALMIGLSLWARRSYDLTLARTSPGRGEPIDYCSNAFPPAPEPDVALFIVSDSQFHELRGRRFVGQMEFADALVPVALRPVELDVLSAAPLSRAATVYAALAMQRPAGAKLWWSHLGDMADLSCVNEMDRSAALLRDRFDVNAFAGVAPGNHDKAFTGNFFWSPYWDSACPSGRLEKELSDRKLAQAWQGAITAAHGRMAAVSGLDPIALATRRGSALVTATPLGVVRHHAEPRGLIGVYLDSSDGGASDLGVAGLFATFSDNQAKTAKALVEDVRMHAGSDYANPLYVIFLHAPVGEMAPWSLGRFRNWVAELDGPGNHVLGIISAHTHEVQKHSHCIDRRMIPEVVVGSTIDPPQEAALLSVGPMADGNVGMRVQTLPMVGRAGKTCASRAPTVTAAQCQSIMAALRAHDDCDPLFRPGEASALGGDCSALESPYSVVNERLLQASRWSGPGDEQEIQADQRARVAAMWKCICRDGQCKPSAAALDLDDDSYFALVRAELARSPERERELVCLAWAGAAVQAYKTAGMRFPDALRCAYDDDKMPSAHDFIARLEVTPCY
jgi:hypothetical protein